MTDRGQDWSPPGVLRAMLWWPPVAFVLAITMPGAGLLPIMAAGLVLAVVGVGSAALARRRRPAEAAPAGRIEHADPVAAPIAMPQRRAA